MKLNFRQMTTTLPRLLLILFGLLLAACASSPQVRTDRVVDSPNPEQFVGHWEFDFLEYKNDNRAFLTKLVREKARRAGKPSTDSEIQVLIDRMDPPKLFLGVYLNFYADGTGNVQMGTPDPLPIRWKYAKGAVAVTYPADASSIEYLVSFGKLKLHNDEGIMTFYKVVPAQNEGTPQ